MKRSLIAAALSLAVFSLLAAPADARPRHPVSHAADPGCNVIFPCQDIAPSARGLRVVKAMRGFGSARLRYSPRASTGGLVDRARAYMGSNPTGWGRVWCGRFMAMVAPDAAAKLRNPNMARDWAALPHTSGRVGDIAVLSRGRRGGHVGVVSGFDARGNPIIVSGNHGHRVGEGVYPRSRVLAYVSPS